MNTSLKDIIERSGKKTVVFYENKEKRTSFDESFAKKKMAIITKFIGGDENSIKLSKKLATI